MYNSKTIIAGAFCLIIAGTIISLILMKPKKDHLEKEINPALQIIKENWDGNIKIGDKYYNEAMAENISFGNVLKWQLSSNPQKKEKKKDHYLPTIKRTADFKNNKDKIIWFGHSSFYISLNGVKILTDPCYHSLPSGKRKVPIPYEIDSIGSIDYLLVSHTHFDHFQKSSVKEIVSSNPEITALIPLGANKLFKGKLRNVKTQEAGWYQEYKLNDENTRIIFLPAKHWNKRGVFDYNKTLWGSFLIITDHTKIFFAGDSGYDIAIYKDIQNLFGDIDICIFPIGAYSPKYVMENNHMNPEEAVKAFQDMEGKQFIPMHYGTYDLSDEPLGEPIRRTRQCFTNSPEQLLELAIGEEFIIE